MDARFRIKLWQKNKLTSQWDKKHARSLWGENNQGLSSTELLFNLFKYLNKNDISLTRIFCIEPLVKKIREYDSKNQKHRPTKIFETKPIFNLKKEGS